MEDFNWDANEESIRSYRNLEEKRNNLSRIDEVAWRQRSGAIWLKHGD